MLYQLSSAEKNYKKVKRTTLANIGWTEKDLENLLSQNINDLIYANDLMTIFTERALQEEPDMLALDAKGDLYIFELKRWASSSENLLQVLRYGQLFGGSSYDDLNDLFKKHSKGSVELSEAHANHFDLTDSNKLEACDYNKKQHFIIVTNGLDQATIEAIAYWKKNGLNIDAITYWVYQIGEAQFIEFDMYSPVEGYLSYEGNAYVLNTNDSNDKKCTQDMLTNHKAAAYNGRWKEKIRKLQKGDCVFLYQSNVGIIAYGKADGKLEMAEYEGYANEEFYMHLDDFQILKVPMSPSEMKRIADKGFPFLQTMYSISEEICEKFIADIKKKRL